MEEQLYRKFYEVEKRHWWFVARQRILTDILQRLDFSRSAQILDVGCGAGAILESFSKNFDAYGTDTSPLSIELCHQRGLRNVFQCMLDDFPRPEMRFDLISLLDVIEHIEDDQRVLRQARDYLKPGGFILITVPAYRWLWSRHDDLNHHQRRYVKSELAERLTSTGFAIQMLSYYNTVLFPIALASRVTQNILKSQTDPTLEIPHPLLNSLFTAIFAAERYWLRRATFPFGLSLVALARKA